MIFEYLLTQNVKTLYYMSPVTLEPQKFARPPCWCYLW